MTPVQVHPLTPNFTLNVSFNHLTVHSDGRCSLRDNFVSVGCNRDEEEQVESPTPATEGTMLSGHAPVILHGWTLTHEARGLACLDKALTHDMHTCSCFCS